MAIWLARITCSLYGLVEVGNFVVVAVVVVTWPARASSSPLITGHDDDAGRKGRKSRQLTGVLSGGAQVGAPTSSPRRAPVGCASASYVARPQQLPFSFDTQHLPGEILANVDEHKAPVPRRQPTGDNQHPDESELDLAIIMTFSLGAV